MDSLLPGLTGWAQVNGRDEIAVPEKVKLDLEYLQKKSTLLDLKFFDDSNQGVQSRGDTTLTTALSKGNSQNGPKAGP